MRQTLLRIMSETWTWRSYPDRLEVGIGYFLLLWAAYGAFWFVRHGAFAGSAEKARANKSGDGSDNARIQPVPAVITWLIVAAILRVLPGWFEGGIPVYGYGFMLFLGFLAAGWSATRRARMVGIPEDSVWDVGVWIFFSGIAGARLFYLAQYHERVLGGKQGAELLKAAFNLSDGGLVFYGGVILGTVTYLVYCHRRSLSPLLFGDVLIPSIFIGLAFGRGGCFLNGCCFGDRCELPWGVHFPQDSVPWNLLVDRGFLEATAKTTFALHPTQLYSVLNALMLAALTSVYFRYRPQNGSVLAVGFVLYPPSRMVIELLRGDEMGQFGTDLTISQWVSLGLSALSVAYLVYLSRNRGAAASESAATGDRSTKSLAAG